MNTEGRSLIRFLAGVALALLALPACAASGYATRKVAPPTTDVSA